MSDKPETRSDGIKPTFAGEMQLAGWSETHTGGCKVTFWLESSEDLDAFRALTVRKGNTAGHRFMAALVEIGDDEQPVQEPEKSKGGALAKLAGMWCETPEFRTWLKKAFPHHVAAADGYDLTIEERAACVVRAACHVISRAEFDNDEEAGERFQRLIRRPYVHYTSRAMDRATA